MTKSKLLMTALAALALALLQACASSDLRPTEASVSCEGGSDDKWKCKGTVKWTIPEFAGLAGPALSASNFVVTREVDPAHMSYTNGQKTGTLILKLSNGSTVSYSGQLNYSAYWSSQIPAHDSSKQVIAFVPANPSSVQAFIDQYSSQTTNATYKTTIGLNEVYNGSLLTTYVDSQVAYQGARAFAARGLARIGDRGTGGGPPVYLTSATDQ